MSAKVDVWRISLLASERHLLHLVSDLAPDEREAANRFRFEHHRRRFMAARAALRGILAQYVGGPPGALRFDYNSYGKPLLSGARHAAEVAFNLAHSEDWAMIAVSSGFPVGIDIEFVRPTLATVDMIALVFSPSEQAALTALTGARRTEAFFKGWISKEAYIKGLGEGLSIPLHEFDVSVDPDRPAELLRPYSMAPDKWSWSLHDLEAPPGYVAALASAETPVHVAMYTWQAGN